MPSIRKTFRGIAISLFALFSLQAQAQTTDTLLVDYTSFSGCGICGDNDYSCPSLDSLQFIDSTTSGLKLVQIKFLFLHTPCTSSPAVLTLNGDTMGSITNSNVCQCFTCTLDSVVVTGSKLGSHVQNDTNMFRFSISSGSMCISQYMIIRTWVPAVDYNMATTALVGPIYACPGADSIKVRVANFGQKQVDSVEVHWKYNGTTQTMVKTTGTIDTLGGSGSHTKDVTLGSKTLVKGKQDTLVAWTEKPNGQTDTIRDNDTLTTIVAPAFKDSITVGGSSPDFTKIQDALDAVMQFGICGPVIIKIRSGTYNEQLVLGPVPGADSTNTLTIQSSVEDSSAVKIYFSGTSTQNFTLQLQMASFVRFRHLTFEATGTSYTRVIWLNEACENIGFYNCDLIGITGNTSTDRAVIFSNPLAIPCNNVTFDNCRVRKGSWGAYIYNKFNNKGEGYTFTNNVFIDQHYRNVEMRYCQVVNIFGNNCNRSTTAVSYGHNFYFADNSGPWMVANNNLLTTTGGTGIEVSWHTGDTGNVFKIFNNFVSVTSPSSTSCRPLYLYYPNHLFVAHNSFFAECSYSSNNAVYIYNGSNIRLSSNAVFNKNPGKAIHVEYSGSPNVIHSNHNNFFSLGSNMGFWNTTVANLSLWQSVSGQDSSSKSADPVFTSTTDLHASGIELNGNGDPTTGIMDDIDGQARDTVRPDIGADEFDLPPIDAALIELKKFKDSTSCVNVVLRNLGNDTLTSVTIAWTLNGVSKTAYSWTGSLPSADTAIVCIGTHTFKRDTAYDLKIWTSSPNGVTDTINGNDTITKTVYPALCGVYTIGGSSPDYSTFSLAVDALKKAGVIDSAIFKVRDGTYTDQIHITKIECADVKDQVIFESESQDSTKVKLTYSSASWSNNYVIWLDGADGITFRHMTIEHLTTYYKRVILVSNGADNNLFRNNIIQNDDSLSSSTSYALIYNESTPDHNLCIINNRLLRGSYAYYGRGSYSDHDVGLLIQGNIISNQGYVGIDALYNRNMRILSNNLSSQSTNYWSGMDLDEGSGKSRIEKNKVIGPMLNEDYGIYINDFDFGDSTWIVNNFVSIGGAGTFGYGIYVEDFTHAEIFNNSVRMSQPDSLNSGAIYFEDGIFNSCNNNFICVNGGFGMNRNFGTVNSDYNNVLTPSARFSKWGSTTYPTLASHIAGTTNDSNSIGIDPQFESATDLHVTNPALNMTGKSIAYVTDDIDGDTRDTVPDIGADEFVPAKFDIGVSEFITPGSTFPADTVPVKVVVYNYGTDSVFSGTVKTKFNDDTLADKSFSDTLASGDTTHVSVGSYVFRSDTTYNIFAWTVKPNGVTDQKMSNDSSKYLNKLAALTGDYTIGGTSPDFPDFDSAVTALIQRGIVGTVRFKVRNGTYTEQVIIPPISGADAKNSIVFEGENKDSSLVILTYASTRSDSNYTVFVNGADGVTFRHMTIKATSSSYGRVINFSNEAHRLCVENCHIEGYNITWSSSSHYLVYSQSTIDSQYVFRYNRFVNGSYQINITCPWTYSQRDRGGIISHNKFRSYATYGIYTDYQRQFEIVGNSFTDDASTSLAMYLYYPADRFTVSKNNIQLTNYGDGMYFNYPGNGAGDSCFVTNNMISMTKPGSSDYGINCYVPTGLRIAHNSISLSGPSATNSRCLQMNGGGSGNYVYNNILDNQAAGYTHYTDNPSTIAGCDYNNMRSSGSNFAYHSSSMISNMAAWRSVSGFDSSGTTFNPGFASGSDLHVSNVDLDATVMRLPYVLDDIDGESRDSTADVGADEIRLKGLDAGIVEILTPNMPFLSDTQYVKVVLKNFGTTTLTSVDIHWVLNGDTGTVYSWSDTLKSKDTAEICIEKKFFDLDSTYGLKAWTSKPNNGTDSLATNDTAETTDQYPALSGTYTIGGASPDFADFTSAVTALKRGGIVDSVIFNVRNGTYNEQITIPRILGAENKNSIVFQSIGTGNAANVVLTDSVTSWSSNWLVRLDSARGITFRRITFKPLGYYYGRGVEFRNNADYNEITGCIFTGNTYYNYTSTDRALVYTQIVNSHNNDFNCIIGNTFTNGAYGIYHYGYNSGTYDKKWMITGNTFTNNHGYGIYMYYCDTATVSGNTATHDGTYSTSTNYGIALYYFRRGYEITRNNVNGQYQRALYIEDCDGSTTNRGLIANNMAQASKVGAYAFYASSCGNTDIYYNSAYASSATGTNRAFQSGYQSNTRLVNNIFFNNSSSGYAWYHNGTASSFTSLDHNNYYAPNSDIAYFSYSSRTAFSDLKTATGRDTNSLNVDPSFVSTTDLHAREITLDEAGTPFSRVSIDYDQEPRDTSKPDIGADEFEPPAPEDAGIVKYHSPEQPFKSGTKNVEVVLKNFGSDTLTSATINWRVNSILQTSYSWTGSLLPGKSDTVTIGSYPFAKVTEYNFILWSTNPNGVADTLNYNDTAFKNQVYAALDTTYTIGSSGADFPDFTTAARVLQLAGILDTVTFRVQSGTYTEHFALGSYSGAMTSRPVTFESLTGDSTNVILTYSSTYDSNYLVKLSGAENVRFRNMTFKPTNHNYGHAIVYSGGSHGLQVQNCQFLGLNNPYYYGSIFISSSTDNDDSCRLENNYFYRGGRGIEVFGLGSHSPEKGLVINNNSFTQGSRNPIYLAYHEDLAITRNHIAMDNTTYGKTAIYTSSTKNLLDISCNNIVGTGVYDNGIFVSHTGSASLNGRISNNFISLKNNSSGEYGLYVSYSNYTNVMFNSINIYGGTVASTYAFRVNYGSDVQVKNNILCNRNGGYAYYRFGTGVTQSDYNDIYTTGTNLGFYSGNQTSLSAWKTATSMDANSISIDPLFTSNENLHAYISSLDSAGTPISGITEDIDKDTRNTTHPDIGADEFNSLLHNIGVSAITAPVLGCDLDSQVVTITIFNYGSQPQTNYSVCYSVDGGTAVKDTITDTIGPGMSKSFSFTTKHKFVGYQDFKIKAWTKLAADQANSNDSATVTVTNHQTPLAVSNMYPIDTTKNVDYPITFSWAPATGASKYDLYIWDDTASSRPGSPFKSDISQISTQVTSGLTYGRTYKWQVVSKNVACGTDGPIQKFTMRYLPDLIVESVSSPTTAFSGNNVSISWTIKNQGGGATGSAGWYDAVYLSTDTIYDNADLYMGGIANLASLNASQNYSNNMSVSLPNGMTGTYYAIVRTDRYNNVIEVDDGNNTGHDTSGMVVSLTPPPDLRVDAITRPSVAFSGSKINISYTVKNHGTGGTRTTSWHDYIYWSADTTFGGSATYLGRRTRTGALDPDSTYSFGALVTVPNFISGRHYVYVYTDATDAVYEHTNETNNVTRSDTIGVILSPPPDLVVRDLVLPDTASTCDALVAKYLTVNQGGGGTLRGFYDAIYYSTSSTYSSSTVTHLRSTYNSALVAGDTAVKNLHFSLPNNIEGKYYFFVLTDQFDAVNEHVHENNNVSAVDSIIIVSPDLQIASVSTSATDTTGDTTMLRYEVINPGLGKVLTKGRTDRFYISKKSTWDLDSATHLSDQTYSTAIDTGDTLVRNVPVTIPDGFDGEWYFYVHTDFHNTIFENGIDNNNVGGSNKVTITLAPYPDLIPSLTIVPDTGHAGDTATFEYVITNSGDTTAFANWADRIYVSTDSIFDGGDQQISSIVHTNDLEKDSSYTVNTLLTLPSSLPAGDYWYFLKTDADDNVYEHFGDTNNVDRSEKKYVDGYPPIDLKAMSMTVPDTLHSGKQATISWTVKNVGQAATVAPFWNDCIFVSTDSVLNVNADTRIHTEQVNTTVSKDSSYTVNLSFTVPNGLSGTYYVFVRSDKGNANNDVDTNNNTEGKRDGGSLTPATFILTPPPDLQVALQSVPSNGVAGQQIQVIWTVTNKGTGPTLNSYWNDHIYLSTDYTLDNSDYRIGNAIHLGDLAKDSSYTDTLNPVIPGSFVGNYILIIATDAENREYEFTNENNNTASIIISVSQAPPADLVVEDVMTTDSITSGDNIKVTWTVKNDGANPAKGYLQDNVYLSKDTVVDATDLLLGTRTQHINIAPAGTKDDSLTAVASGVALGNYYVLVKTDIRNNINESNDTNNTGKSELLNIDIPEIFVGVKKMDNMPDNTDKLYRVHIADSLKDESLLLTLEGDSANGNNELYMRYGDVPSRSEFDFGYSDPFAGDQEIVVPELDTGTYYILAFGDNTNGTSQAIELLARKLEFEIRKVTPSKGGNTGQVTVKIEGSKFTDSTTFLLTNESGTIGAIEEGPTEDAARTGDGPQQADTFLVVNPTLAYITFDLTGHETGVYDMLGVNQGDSIDNDTTKLKSAFTVQQGLPPDIQLSVTRPANARTNRVVSFDVNFSNEGNVDIVNGVLEIISNGTTPISFTVDGLSDNKTTLEIPLEEDEGIKGRLRPGGIGNVKVYSKASNTLGFSIVLPE